MNDEPKPRCFHGKVGYCGLCKEDGEPRCRHGNPNYCGHCGDVSKLKHTYSNEVPNG